MRYPWCAMPYHVWNWQHPTPTRSLSIWAWGRLIWSSLCHRLCMFCYHRMCALWGCCRSYLGWEFLGAACCWCPIWRLMRPCRCGQSRPECGHARRMCTIPTAMARTQCHSSCRWTPCHACSGGGVLDWPRRVWIRWCSSCATVCVSYTDYTDIGWHWHC